MNRTAVEHQNTYRKKTLLFKLISMWQCLVILFTMCACSNAAPSNSLGSMSAGSSYFSVNEQMGYEGSSDDFPYVTSVHSSQFGTAVLLSVENYSQTSQSLSVTNNDTVPAKCIILLYSPEGLKTGQIDVSSILETDDTVLDFSMADDGSLQLLIQKVSDSYTPGYYIVSFDSAGISSGIQQKLACDSDFWCQQMLIDSKGDVCLGGQGILYVFDKNGTLSFQLKDKSLQGSLYLFKDTVYADAEKTDTGKYQYLLYPVNFTSEKLGNPIDMTLIRSSGDSILTSPDGFYLQNTAGIKSYDLKTKKSANLLRWKDSDIPISLYTSAQFIVLSKDKILCVCQTYSDTSIGVSVSLLVREAKNPNAGKKELVIAGVGLLDDWKFMASVEAYNKNSGNCKIVVKDYSTSDELVMPGDNRKAATSQMLNSIQMELLAGSGPDIICEDEPTTISTLEATGLLADLYPLMDGDKNFHKNDYIQNIFDLAETNGHLYKVITDFSIEGLIGSEALLGDSTGWTLDEFNMKMGSLPSGIEPLPKIETYSSILSRMLSNNIDEYVNYHTGIVNIDTEGFYQLLEFAKAFGIPDATDVDVPTIMLSGKFAANFRALYTAFDYNRECGIVGSTISCIGIPSADRRGPACVPSRTFAITATCTDQQDAWNFIKYFLSEDMQEQTGIPVLKSAFEKSIEYAMDPKTDYGDYYGHIEPMNEEQAQAFRNLVNSLNTISGYDMDLLQIVLEEAPAYFAGQKSVEDVASLIQNRVQTLVDERGKAK